MTRYAKALAAFLTLLGTWGATAAADGQYDQIELWGICGVLVGALAVFQIPNRPPAGRRRKANISEQDPAAGHVDVTAVLVGLIVLVVVLLLLGRL